MANDRNFDDLAHRFARNVYGDLKGRVRLAVLERDFNEFLPDVLAGTGRAQAILDAGGGQGQFSLKLAERGHSLVICDLSQEMLKHALAEAEARNLLDRVEIYHGSIQQYLAENPDRRFDLILCHAVLEWVVEQRALIALLLQHLRVPGHLSLSYYNVNSLVFKNLLRGNYKKIRSNQLRGFRRSLTPSYPLEIEQVEQWLAAEPAEVLCRSGIRCFHDYILDPEVREGDAEGLQEMELRFSRQSPYWQMARYIHKLIRRN